MIDEAGESIVKSLTQRMADYLIESLIEQQHFTESTGQHLQHDCHLLFERFRMFSRKPENRFFRKLKVMELVYIL